MADEDGPQVNDLVWVVVGEIAWRGYISAVGALAIDKDREVERRHVEEAAKKVTAGAMRAAMLEAMNDHLPTRHDRVDDAGVTVDINYYDDHGSIVGGVSEARRGEEDVLTDRTWWPRDEVRRGHTWFNRKGG